MPDTKRDHRKIGGNRVSTVFSMVVANPDPFNSYADKFSGTIVFNARGGCMFIDSEGPLKAHARIFSDGPVAILESLELDIPEQKPCVIKKIRIKNARQKTIGGRNGIVFKFFQTSEVQMDQLNGLVEQLPPVASDTEVVSPRKSA